MTVYAKTARFDTAVALSNEELHKLAPSIFARQAHESRSERFAPIATIDALDELRKEGFMPVGAKQSLTRVPGKAAFTKHLIRLRKIEDDHKFRVGDTVCEVLLKNANDGTSMYDLFAGLFRIACMNSMVCQTGTIDRVKVRHSGDAMHKVIEGTYSVLDNAHLALEAPDAWSQIQLAKAEAEAFAKAAHAARFADNEGNVTTAIRPEQLLDARRQADNTNDLWTTFNRVQENAVRGGLASVGLDTNGRTRIFRSREVKGIEQDVKLNRALWTLAAEMAKIKAA
jgi:hypothetical protein